MSPFDFLTHIWPDAGLYCLATPAKQGYSHKVVGSVEDAVDWIAKHAEHKNIFFAVHALREAQVYNPRKQNHDGTVGGMSVRLQANMRASRAFFFDLDVGEGEAKFTDQREALTALKDFCTTTGLPRPTMVSSGGGIHVYWVIDEELPSSPEWQLRAQKLKQLAQHYDFKVDPARTTDTSSVLRVPSTLNLKGGLRRPVQVYHQAPVIALAEFDAIVDGAMVGCNLSPKQVAVAQAAFSNTQREFEGRKLTAIEVFQTCGQMARMARAKGNVSEPEWYQGLSVIVELQNADTLIHKFSEGHPGYSHGATVEKAARAKIGPTTCQKLYDVSSTKAPCAACKFYDSGEFKTKGPLAATRLAADQAEEPVIETLVDGRIEIEEIPNPPAPYKRDKTKGIVIIREDDEGKQYQQVIFDCDLYPIARHRNGMLDTEFQTWRYHPRNGGVKDFQIEAGRFVDDKQLKVVLSGQGIYAGTDFPALSRYMSAYIQELVRNKPLGTQHNHLGWADDHQRFVLGTKAIRRDGESDPVTFGPVAQDAPRLVSHAGSLSDQVKLMRFFNRKELVAQQFQICAALASPLLHYTTEHGVICHATGETGGLKSTTLLACAGLWGNPNKYHLNGSAKGATTNARMTRMEILSNLPLCLDELTNVDAQEVRDFALGISQAQGRQRLDRFGNPRPMLDNDKSSVIITNANKSLYNMVMMDALANAPAAMRIFEIEFAKQGSHITSQAPGLLHGLNGNYGHIGEAFMRHVMKSYDAVKQRQRDVAAKLWPEWEGHGGERMWWTLDGIALVAGGIAKDIGLLSFDLDLMAEFAKETILRNRSTVHADTERHNPVTVFADYLNHASGSTLVTTNDTKGEAYPVGNAPHGAVTLQHDLSSQTMLVSREGLQGYCKTRGVPMRVVCDELVRLAIIIDPNTKRVIGQGTLFARGRVPCLLVNMAHPALAGTAPGPVTIPAAPTSNVVPLKKPGKP